MRYIHSPAATLTMLFLVHRIFNCIAVMRFVITSEVVIGAVPVGSVTT
ncbi:hypothetical protein [Citrobacter gillenii]